MAHKRKTSHRKPTTHRRRISGAGKFDVAGTLGIIAGAVASKFVNRIPVLGTMDGKILAAAKIGLGVFLPHIAGKSPMVHALGLGMVAGGGLDLVGPTGLNLISGIGEDTYQLNLGMPTVSGVDAEVISGFDDEKEY